MKPQYNEPARRVRLGRGCVELPYGGILGREFGHSFPRKVVLNNKNGRASTAPSKRSDNVIRYNDPVDSNVLAGKQRMTLFDPTPSLVKCNEHVPDYIRNPVIKNAFSTTLALTLQRGSAVSS